MAEGSERRKYIRISTVLPVEFRIIDEKGNRVSPWLQGFTQDISKGGICLVVNDLWWGYVDKISPRGARLFVKIDLPLKGRSIISETKVAWFRQDKLDDFNRYTVGLEFSNLQERGIKGLYAFAVMKKFSPLLVGGLISILVFFSLFSLLLARTLISQNRKLVSEYVGILESSSSLEKILSQEKEHGQFLNEQQDKLKNEITSLGKEVEKWQKSYRELLAAKRKDEVSLKAASDHAEKISILEERLGALQKQNEFLKEKSEERKEATRKIKEEVKELRKEKFSFSRKVIEGTYDWIKNRQDLVRGLVLSYEGDDSLEKTCFSYDQALATIVFLVAGDIQRAEKILDFYARQLRKGQPIYNAYYTQGSVFEYVVHSGPNAWLGVAALNHAKMTGNKKYLSIARKVGEFLFKMMDDEGGIKGGPKVSWYSTEHNLDAYAFFTLYYELTGDHRYGDAASKIKSWISRHTYTRRGPPINRGKGDATIATDTYAWSVTAFGPEGLLSLNMNPESILEFAIEQCEVETNFKRREGEVSLRGFDFAKIRHAARGGVVSGEWTAQMILAFEVMADYYKNKDPEKFIHYLEKAVFYFNELQKMLITSPSRAGREDPCLPYASASFVDTGHGWRTPKGNRTGSLASTSFFLISYYGYNPLQGRFLNTSLKEEYEKRRSQVAQRPH
ncbi:MAG: PilZ domain-containing protein [Candidatus Omnitrophota bacterium]|nr:MAG: PilZ domain-containing protein [Candidatus Omnitrophota bacterium]